MQQAGCLLKIYACLIMLMNTYCDGTPSYSPNDLVVSKVVVSTCDRASLHVATEFNVGRGADDGNVVVKVVIVVFRVVYNFLGVVDNTATVGV